MQHGALPLSTGTYFTSKSCKHQYTLSSGAIHGMPALPSLVPGHAADSRSLRLMRHQIVAAMAAPTVQTPIELFEPCHDASVLSAAASCSPSAAPLSPYRLHSVPAARSPHGPPKMPDNQPPS
mmetsp:Transcript_45831/g.120188  ORF Transcript_45831/g.120188 Transcript_45831/m.120188 type:complete len:123 (-) Transcript_45831:2664-3032(-)